MAEAVRSQKGEMRIVKKKPKVKRMKVYERDEEVSWSNQKKDTT